MCVQRHIDAIERDLVAGLLVAANCGQRQHVAALAQPPQIALHCLVAPRRIGVWQVFKILDVRLSLYRPPAGAGRDCSIAYLVGHEGTLAAGDAVVLGNCAASIETSLWLRWLRKVGRRLAPAAQEADHSHDGRAGPQDKLHQIGQALNQVAVIADKAEQGRRPPASRERQNDQRGNGDNRDSPFLHDAPPVDLLCGASSG